MLSDSSNNEDWPDSKPSPELKPSAGLAERIQKYYTHPDPGTLPGLFAECWAAGLFRFKNGKPNPITLTFFAAALDATGEAGWEGFIDELLAGNNAPKVKIRQSWVSRLFNREPGPEYCRNSLFLIAFLSRNEEQRPLRYFLSRSLPPDSDLEAQLAQAETQLAAMRPQPLLTSPLQIDQWWAYFYASGDESAMRPVIAAANGDGIAATEDLTGEEFTRDAIMHAAAYSLIELAPNQPRICQIIYAALDDYQQAPVYPALIIALQRAGVARLSFNPDGSANISFQVPPEWQ